MTADEELFRQWQVGSAAALEIPVQRHHASFDNARLCGGPAPLSHNTHTWTTCGQLCRTTGYLASPPVPSDYPSGTRGLGWYG